MSTKSRELMERLFIEETLKTPEINFNPGAGIFSIKGKLIPDDAESFYS